MEGTWAGMGYPEMVDFTVFFHVYNKRIGNKILDAMSKNYKSKAKIDFVLSKRQISNWTKRIS